MTRSEKVVALLPYVRDLADRLLLKDWRVVVGEQLADQGNNAEIFPAPGQRHATIYLGHDFFEKSPEEIRYVLCHELIHCHFDHADKIAERGMDKLRHDDFRLAVEYGVDDVARLVAPHMPLPPDGEPAKKKKPRR